MTSAVNLATLPDLIISKIIRVADVESFNVARLIVRQWNQLALDSLKFRARLPVINYFRWRVNHSKWHLFMQVADRYRGYFGVEKWIDNDMSDDEIVDIELAVDTRNSLMENRLRRLFNRCSRIEKLEIISYIENYEVIASAMGNTPVDELKVSNLRKFDTFSINTLVNFIRAHSDGKITMRFDNYNLWSSNRLNLTTLFTEASRLVPEIDCIVGDALPIELANLRMSWENSLSTVARAANSTYIFESTALPSGCVRLRVGLKRRD
ncbi:hypothetical protein PRIPAC_87639 [Pristionchus pacificus]|uniref:F-box domain-containing protein n=1 Tax=Pristionchus pacificus TaxID=54126 RepID=A0A2A6CYS1_PRIPA|nr:hypothetical protein PRIPAC_87639 [Pristionchus pacificus]|eukprot:PDM83163.1 hypothetical protein PRIPAC_37556 [Pristionchus pacificus]